MFVSLLDENLFFSQALACAQKKWKTVEYLRYLLKKKGHHGRYGTVPPGTKKLSAIDVPVHSKPNKYMNLREEP